MEIQASRLRARWARGRTDTASWTRTVSRWDRLLIHRGLLALARGETLGESRGPYLLQAAIAACHARAATAADTDWVYITALYDELARAHALSGGRAEPRGRGRDGVWAGGGPGARRPARGAGGAAQPIICCRACAAICSPGSAAYAEARGEFERAAALTQQCAREPPAARSRRRLPTRRDLMS